MFIDENGEPYCLGIFDGGQRLYGCNACNEPHIGRVACGNYQGIYQDDKRRYKGQSSDEDKQYIMKATGIIS